MTSEPPHDPPLADSAAELPKDPFEQLMRVLDIAQLDADTFQGISQPQPHGRAFGGQVLAQCVVAAGRTVMPVTAGESPRRIHSLHGYFLRPADSTRGIRFEVERLRDGRSFSARRVHAFQGDKVLLSMITSFQEEAGGLDHQADMPQVPAPQTLRPLSELLGSIDDPRAQFVTHRPVDMRHVQGHLYLGEIEPAAQQQVWMHTTGEVGGDALLNAAVLTYLSDYTLLEPVLRAHGVPWTDPRLRPASLDHAMWFHRTPRTDDWILYAQESPSGQSGRGLGLGHMFHSDGGLLATVAQEGMVRLKE